MIVLHAQSIPVIRKMGVNILPMMQSVIMACFAIELKHAISPTDVKQVAIHVESTKHVMKCEMSVNEHDVRLIVIAMMIMCVTVQKRVTQESASRE